MLNVLLVFLLGISLLASASAFHVLPGSSAAMRSSYRSPSELSERLSGIVRSFNTKRGFGFIVPKDGSPEVFVHYNDIDKTGFKSLGIGESVEFDVVLDDANRRRATRVTGPSGAPILGFYPMRNNALQQRGFVQRSPQQQQTQPGSGGPQNQFF